MAPIVNLIATIGKSGQAGLKGTLPAPLLDGTLWTAPVTIGGILVFGSRMAGRLARALDCPDADFSTRILPGRVLAPFGSHNQPASYLDHLVLRWPGWPIWIAGGPATWRAFAPHINGLRLISVVDYDGEADAWFPFDAFGMEIKAHV